MIGKRGQNVYYVVFYVALVSTIVLLVGWAGPDVAPSLYKVNKTVSAGNKTGTRIFAMDTSCATGEKNFDGSTIQYSYCSYPSYERSVGNDTANYVPRTGWFGVPMGKYRAVKEEKRADYTVQCGMLYPPGDKYGTVLTDCIRQTGEYVANYTRSNGTVTDDLILKADYCLKGGAIGEDENTACQYQDRLVRVNGSDATGVGIKKPRPVLELPACGDFSTGCVSDYISYYVGLVFKLPFHAPILGSVIMIPLMAGMGYLILKAILEGIPL